jgi:uncharacterized protein
MAHCRKKQLSIFINNKCNLKCRYCYDGANGSANKKNKKIDIEFVKCGITDYFNNYSSREIRFFANGEPTLELDLIKEIREFALSMDKNSTFELQTNGFFSKSVAEWIGDNIDIVWVSYDGLPEAQDYYRPVMSGESSSLVVENNIKLLASKSLTLGCRATIGKKNIDKQVEMIDFLGSLGVKAVMSDPMFASVEDCNSVFSNNESPSLMKYAKEFLKAREHAEHKRMFYGSILSVNFDEKTMHACRACIPYPHLTIDGYVSACDMATDINNKGMSSLIYGKYDKRKNKIIYNKEVTQKISLRTAPNMKLCQDCEVLYNCAGACVGEALNETGSIYGIKPEVCKAIKYLAKRMPLNKGRYPYLHP